MLFYVRVKSMFCYCLFGDILFSRRSSLCFSSLRCSGRLLVTACYPSKCLRCEDDHRGKNMFNMQQQQVVAPWYMSHTKGTYKSFMFKTRPSTCAHRLRMVSRFLDKQQSPMNERNTYCVLWLLAIIWPRLVSPCCLSKHVSCRLLGCPPCQPAPPRSGQHTQHESDDPMRVAVHQRRKLRRTVLCQPQAESGCYCCLPEEK